MSQKSNRIVKKFKFSTLKFFKNVIFCDFAFKIMLDEFLKKIQIIR